MKTARTLPLLSLLLLVACASSDPVRRDRFDQNEGSGGDDGAGGGVLGTTAGSDGAGAGAQSGATSGQSTGAGSPTGGTTGSGTTVCTDDGPEGNDSEATATDLGAIDDCDGDGGAVSGVLDSGDVDWFVYHGDDVTGCIVNPWRSLDADTEYRICKFVECDDGSPNYITCPEGTSPETSPDGRQGCCSLQAFELSPDCESWTDSAKVYVRLDAPPSSACVHYTLSFHY